MNHSQRFRYLIKNPHLVWANPKRVFMLSHMRSRSSLLSHILGSNEEICGYSELSVSYKSFFSLIDQKIALHQDGLQIDSSKILFDKLLHRFYDFKSCTELDKASSNVIIMLRQPEATIKSIATMGRRDGNKRYSDVNYACDYYSQRLSSLVSFSKKLNKFVYLNSDDIVNETERTLLHLSKVLNLKSPLSKEYSSFNKTGKEKSGDTSENIKIGKVIKTKENNEVLVPDSVIKKLNDKYLEATDLMRSKSL